MILLILKPVFKEKFVVQLYLIYMIKNWKRLICKLVLFDILNIIQPGTRYPEIGRVFRRKEQKSRRVKDHKIFIINLFFETANILKTNKLNDSFEDLKLGF